MTSIFNYSEMFGVNAVQIWRLWIIWSDFLCG